MTVLLACSSAEGRRGEDGVERERQRDRDGGLRVSRGRRICAGGFV